jgi:hypothetical protein
LNYNRTKLFLVLVFFSFSFLLYRPITGTTVNDECIPSIIELIMFICSNHYRYDSLSNEDTIDIFLLVLNERLDFLVSSDGDYDSQTAALVPILASVFLPIFFFFFFSFFKTIS